MVQIVSLVVHVSTSVHQRQSLQVTSILSTLMLAQSAAHALMYVLTRLYLSHKEKALSKNYKAPNIGSFFYCIFIILKNSFLSWRFFSNTPVKYDTVMSPLFFTPRIDLQVW